jgi:hypothetical protein
VFSNDEVGAARRDGVNRLLSLLSVAKRPLKWHEIQGYFSFDPDDENEEVDHHNRRLRDDPKDLCWSLVERSPDDSLELVHPTAKECVRIRLLRRSVTDKSS